MHPVGLALKTDLGQDQVASSPTVVEDLGEVCPW
jgi:hypothetical protein